MDPVVQLMNLTAALGMWSAYVIVASFLVEGVCDGLFGWRYFPNGHGLKVPIAWALSIAACWKGDIDAFAMASAGNIDVSLLGVVLSAGFVVGGSKKASQKIGNMKRALKEVQ